MISGMSQDPVEQLHERIAQLEAELEASESARIRAENELQQWRCVALEGWSTQVAEGPGPTEADHLRLQIATMHASTSWKVTKPLRALGSLRTAARHTD